MISVVLASCEGARFIRPQLESILTQLAMTDEVILSDDDSRDCTVDAALSLGDSRLRVLRNARRAGYVGNFERCLGEVRGTHVFFADQDDVWLPGKVQYMLKMLESVACAASDAIVVDEQLNVLHESYFQYRGVRDFSAWELFSRPPIIGATLACRTEYLRRFRPLPPGIPHDMWLTFNAALRGQLGVSSQPLILYRRHSDVASITATGKRRPITTVIPERIRLLFWAAIFAAGLPARARRSAAQTSQGV